MPDRFDTPRCIAGSLRAPTAGGRRQARGVSRLQRMRISLWHRNSVDREPDLKSTPNPRTPHYDHVAAHDFGTVALRKVPEITAYFWVVKVLTTAMGESTSDYLVYHINPYLAVVLGGICLAVSLGLQLAARRYVPWIYWLNVLMVAVFGTMAADAVHIQLGIPYAVSTAFFAVALAIVFLAWYTREHTLSIHSISTLPRELFYWATVMATFALGTATGDLTASTLGLGFFVSALLFAVIIAIPTVAFRLGRMNAIVAFWFAYIVTRPLGASVADWLGKSRSLRGLGFGDGPVSLVFALCIVGFVTYLTRTRVDIKDVPLVRGDAALDDRSGAR